MVDGKKYLKIPKSDEELDMQAQITQRKGKTYLVNAFSLSMIEELLNQKGVVNMRFEKLGNLDVVRLFLGTDFVSAVGHQATASALSKILGINIPANRVSINMAENDMLIVFQLALGRLPPGKELTEEDIINAWQSGKAYFVLVYSPETVEPPK